MVLIVFFLALQQLQYDFRKIVPMPHSHLSAICTTKTRSFSMPCLLHSERIRGKDVPVADRIFLVQPDRPGDALQRTTTYMDRSSLPQARLQQRALTVA